MPKPTKGPRLGGSPSHQRIILANLATQLFEHGSITTTVTRAKRMQPLAEHLITKARRGGLHEIRLVGKIIKDKGVLDHLFREIGPSLSARDGGYTRITKIGNRKGDGAPMAIIEIVTEEVVVKKKTAPKKPAKQEKLADAPSDPTQQLDAEEATEEPEDEAPESDESEEATEESDSEEESEEVDSEEESEDSEPEEATEESDEEPESEESEDE